MNLQEPERKRDSELSRLLDRGASGAWAANVALLTFNLGLKRFEMLQWSRRE